MVCQTIPCKFFFEGVCRYGSTCRFSHDQDVYNASLALQDCDMNDHVTITSTDDITNEDDGGEADMNQTQPSQSLETTQPSTQSTQPAQPSLTCSICMEAIQQTGKRFGILSSCDHIFCIDCLRKWRKQPKTRSVIDVQAALSCPTCRTKSQYVMPSLTFLTGSEKETKCREYLNTLANLDCRHFDGIGTCPHGPDCFYRHVNWDGEDMKPFDKRRAKNPPRPRPRLRSRPSRRRNEDGGRSTGTG